jgi:hypothetical protein
VAPSVVQALAVSNSLTGTLGTPTTAGNCLVYVIITETGTNVTMTVTGATLGGSAGNFAQAISKQSGFASSATQFVAIWVDRNCAGGQTAVAVAGTNLNIGAGTDNGYVVLEIAGLDTSSPVDTTAQASNAATTGTALSTGSTGTTAQASEIAVGGLSGFNSLSSYTSGYTTSGISGGFNTAGYKVLSATGTQSFGCNQSATGPWAAAVITLKAASGTVPVAQADVAGAADVLGASAAAPIADVAGAAESIVITVPAADTAGAADVLAANAAAPQADAAGAADSVVIGVPPADAAGATDSVAISIPAPQADAAGAADSLSVAVIAPMTDAGGAKDAAANITPTPADAGGAKDALTANAAVPARDAGGAADALGYLVGVAPGDAAGATEAVSVVVGITVRDEAGAVDATGVVGAGTGPTGFGSALPASVLNAYTGPGYQGGPSGAGSIAPSALGNGWEINVRSAADYTTLLAVIPGSMLVNWQFARMLNDIGSGTAVLNQDDPWWEQVTLPGGLATETLLDDECLWQVWKDGVCRFEFFGETITEQLVDGSEQRQVTVTGPGTLTSLKWAMVAPQGFPDIVLKLDGLLDAFDEVDNAGNPVLDTNIWTTASPASDVYITPIAVIYNYPTGAGYALSTLYPSGSLTLSATPGTTYLGASPYDATDTLISVEISPIGVSGSSTDTTTPTTYGTGLDGSELTQFYIQSNFNSSNYAMIGLSATAFYAQLGSGGQVQTKILPAYDTQSHGNWMITEQAGSGGGPGTFYFWTSTDGQNWVLQWQVVHSWDATNVTFFVTATYSTAGKQTVQISNLNSNVTTPSYQGSIYLGEPMMGVWLDQFSQAQRRGTIPFVTSTVTAAADSFGRAWNDTENVQATNGTDLYSFLQGATAVVDADFVMNPGFQLVVGVPAAGEVAVGVDRSGYLIFREGYDIQARQRTRARDQIATLIGGENSDGHEISAYSPAFITEWGQREAWFQTSAQVDPVSMAYATAASLAENETEVVSWTFQLLPNVPGKTVFDNFDVGDWVGLERPDFSAVDTVRVVGIAVQCDSSGAETHELTFQSYIQWLAEQLTYLANKLGGAFVNTLGTTPVAPSKYGTGQVPTYFTPAATLSGLADVSSTAGTAQGTAPLVYNPATGQYQHAGSTDPVTGQTIPVTVATPSGSATLGDTSVVVNTGNGSTTVGLQGDGTVATVATGGSAPSVPDVPAVAGIVQGLVVSWDGLLSGALPLSSFSHVAVYVGTTSGFTPSTSNQAGSLSQAGALSVGNLTAGSTYYVKLAALSNSGVSSPPTTGITGVPGTVPTSLLTGQLPASLLGNSAGNALNPNPYFNGGDLTGWFVTNGTVSAAAPPSGAPGGAQFAAQVSSTSANCLLSGSPDPFPVTPGQPYVMTAWVYNPGGTSTTVAIGFNWASGTTTVSVAPGTWVPLTTVQTCPGGVTSAYQVIGPTVSGKTIWILGAVAAGQVPGQLIAANSVAAQQIAANTITAAQIAANTITAAQIAANTITASQIAASTITAAQILASTITASQIAAGTITAAQIAANTITASQIAAGTVTATQIAAGIVLAGVVNGTTITGSQFVAFGSTGEILVYAGTPASGNLIMSVSANAGSDGFSNPYSAGVYVYNSSGGAIGLTAAANTALQLTPGVTPAAVTGTAQLFANSGGHAVVQDGGDAQAYQIQRRSLVAGSNSGALTTPSTVFSTIFGPAQYRVHGQWYVNATSGAVFMCKVIGSGTLAGIVGVTIAEGGSFSACVTGGPNSNIVIAATLGTATYLVTLDGVFGQTVTGLVDFQAGSNTGTSLVVAQYSFLEVMPV